MTHEINHELEERGGVLHVAITDLGCDRFMIYLFFSTLKIMKMCNRLEEMALMLPMVPPGNSDLIQLLTDFKYVSLSEYFYINFHIGYLIDLQTPSIIGASQDSSPSWMTQFPTHWMSLSTTFSRGTPPCPCLD